MTNFIVVTGASKGIGQALVDALVDDGSPVIGARVCRSALLLVSQPHDSGRINNEPCNLGARIWFS
jgi:NAD(P)-dependent dehydrogenase (short-subunit alcohol dehydrogenase family)